jgi:hypothetical protein
MRSLGNGPDQELRRKGKRSLLHLMISKTRISPASASTAEASAYLEELEA